MKSFLSKQTYGVDIKHTYILRGLSGLLGNMLLWINSFENSYEKHLESPQLQQFVWS